MAASGMRTSKIALFHVKLNLSASVAGVSPSVAARHPKASSPLANLVPPLSRMSRNQRERRRSCAFDPGSLRQGLWTKQSKFRAHFVRQTGHGRKLQVRRNHQQFIASVALNVGYLAIEVNARISRRIARGALFRCRAIATRATRGPIPQSCIGGGR